jgi:hypothetical protein
MTVKELMAELAKYPEDAEITVEINDNTCESTYTKGCYDFGVRGNKETYDEYFGHEHREDSDIVAITLYR